MNTVDPDSSVLLEPIWVQPELFAISVAMSASATLSLRKNWTRPSLLRQVTRPRTMLSSVVRAESQVAVLALVPVVDSDRTGMSLVFRCTENEKLRLVDAPWNPM